MDFFLKIFWTTSILLEKEGCKNDEVLAANTGPQLCGPLTETTCW